MDLSFLSEAFSSVHHSFVVSKPGATLLEILKIHLPTINPKSWGQRLTFGGVFVNGLGVFEDQIVPCPCRIEYYEPKFDIDNAEKIYPQFSKDWIVWEDEWLIVCFKPPGLPTMPAKEQIVFNLKSYLEKATGKSLHLPSRLDMSTQGLVIASKHPEMHGPLQQLFEKRQITKRYLFFTSGTLHGSSQTVDGAIGKSQAHPVLRLIDGKDSKEARTELRVLGEGFVYGKDGSKIAGCFIEAIPHTGRTHQIRVHASSVGCPIVGDKFYGGVPAPRLCLLSFSLKFEHPIVGETTYIRVPERLAPDWLRERYNSHDFLYNLQRF